MTQARKIGPDPARLCRLVDRDERWLICVNADPDALGSAMALKRILAHRAGKVDIASVNEVTRPDNLAMIRYLRIPLLRLTAELASGYNRFAMVDSQPHHHPDFAGRRYDIVIDHHPLHPDHPVTAAYVDIRPDYGAVSTILVEYLRALRIRPGKLLATALMYGIKTDTQSFERPFLEADIKAFSSASRFADAALIRRIARSEFHRSWLKYFGRAFRKLRLVGKQGLYIYMERLESPDILVVLADFFTRAHGVAWDMVGGQVGDLIVVIFRGNGLGRNMGRVAAQLFGDIGSAGGHKAAARAEIPLAALGGEEPEEFLHHRLTGRHLTPRRPPACRLGPDRAPPAPRSGATSRETSIDHGPQTARAPIRQVKSPRVT